MMKDFNWNEFKKGKVAVHCPKGYLAEHFLSKCVENGVNTFGVSHLETEYEVFKDDTCFAMWWNAPNGDFGFADTQFYVKEGLEIIKWQLNPTSKEDVEEIAKFMSREEFIEDIVGGYATSGECPSNLGLKDHMHGVDIDCEKCHSKALEGIKFKGDIEEPTKQPIEETKIYSIVEVVRNFKEGIIFKDKWGNEWKIKSGKLLFNSRDEGWRETINTIRQILDTEFILAEEPNQSYTLYQVEHKPNGKQYAFRCNEDLKSISDILFVKCDTSIGEQYGRVMCSVEIELTKAEYEKYKKIERV